MFLLKSRGKKSSAEKLSDAEIPKSRRIEYLVKLLGWDSKSSLKVA